MSNNKSLSLISDFIFTSKYSRYDETLNRRETWDETISRLESMHLKRYGFLDKEDKDKIKWAFGLVREKRIVPSMRALQFGGKAILAHQARQFNCAVRHVDSLRSFAEIFYLLLCGCGVGIGLSKRFLSRLPNLVDASDKTGTVISYVVEDTIEGWSDSVEALLNCYFKNTPYTGRKIVFDYSRIRKKGAILKTGGGKAPGYKGLKESHKKIKTLLDHIIEYHNQNRLKSINAYDILMHCADAVLSGGIRRSATSIIFEVSDDDMINAKTNITVDKVYSFDEVGEETVGGRTSKIYEGKVEYEGVKYDLRVKDWELDSIKKKVVSWVHIFPHRARSNNSVLIDRKTITFEEFNSVIQRTKEFGEPGFVFANDDRTLFNPCFSADTKILTEDGWREFSEILNTTPNIIQDSRVKGSLLNNNEIWDTDLTNIGVDVNKATKVAKTGSNRDIYNLTTTCGRQVKATENHHFSTPNGMVELKDLKVGDEILVAINNLFKPEYTNEDYQIGLLAGLVYGDGCVSNNSAIIDLWESSSSNVDVIQKIVDEVCEKDIVNQKTYKSLPKFTKQLTSENYCKYRLSSTSLFRVLNKFNFTKNNLSWLHKNSKNFKSGFLSGLFYSDGHVDFNSKAKSVSLRITSINFNALQDCQLILQELGVYSKINDLSPERVTQLPNGKGGSSPYNCKPSFRLIVANKDNCRNFAKIIFFSDSLDKSIKFNSIIDSLSDKKYKLNTNAKIKSITYIGKEDVYCLEENNRRTLIAEGLTARRCFEIAFIPVTEDGVCGVQFCNLTSMNGRLASSLAEFKENVEAYTIIGTLQAGYTDFKYLSPAAKKLTEEEALLGCSITGMMDNSNTLLSESNQYVMSEYAKKINEAWAKKIGINPAARITAIKPEGTSSLLLGCASGIHPHHARRYFRRVQCNKLDPVYKFFKKHNPHMCEPSVWSANKTDDVITFPVEVSDKAMVKSDLTAIQHLNIIKSTQKNWVINGTTKYNKKDITNNVSCTVIVGDDEWEEVIKYLYLNRDYFAAVSLLPKMGDKLYAQAPMEAITTKEDEDIWNNIVSNLKEVDYSKLKEDEDNTSARSEVACAGGACEIVYT